MKRVTITPDIIDDLNRLRAESGIGPIALLSERQDAPQGLNPATVTAWMRGKIRSAKPAHIDYVLECWRSATPRLVLDDEIVAELEGHLKRTALTPRAILSNIHPILSGLHAHTISRWVKRRLKSARKDHLDAVLAVLRLAPDAPQDGKAVYQGRTRHQDRLAFTDEHRRVLEQERKRTGVGTTPLLKNYYRDEVPDGLSANMISGWLNGNPKTVAADLYAWTLKAWKALPDEAGKDT